MKRAIAAGRFKTLRAIPRDGGAFIERGPPAGTHLARAIEPLGTAGGLLTAGGALYCIHSALLGIGALLIVVSGGLGENFAGFVGGAIAFVGALLAATAGSFLLAGGGFRLATAVRKLSELGVMRGEAAEVERRGNRAALGLAVCGYTGVVASIVLAILPGLGPTVTARDVDRAFAGAAMCWAIASLVLILACADLSYSVAHVEPRLPGWRGGSGTNLRGYAYLNFAGALSIAIPLVGLALASQRTLGLGICIFGMGAFLEGVLVPIAGIAAFVRLVRSAHHMTGIAFPPATGF